MPAGEAAARRRPAAAWRQRRCRFRRLVAELDVELPADRLEMALRSFYAGRAWQSLGEVRRERVARIVAEHLQELGRDLPPVVKDFLAAARERERAEQRADLAAFAGRAVDPPPWDDGAGRAARPRSRILLVGRL